MAPRLLIALALLLATTTGNAALTSVTAVGTFDLYSFYDPDSLLPFPQPAPGTAFTLTFSYDDNASDLAAEHTTLGLYGSAISAMALTVGDETFSPWPETWILIIGPESDTGGSSTINIWTAGSSLSTPPITERFYLSLTDICGTSRTCPLTSDALVGPPWPWSWMLDTEIGYDIKDWTDPENPLTLARATATIQSITAVPLPPSVFLLATAIGAVVTMVARPEFKHVTQRVTGS